MVFVSSKPSKRSNLLVRWCRLSYLNSPLPSSTTLYLILQQRVQRYCLLPALVWLTYLERPTDLRPLTPCHVGVCVYKYIKWIVNKLYPILSSYTQVSLFVSAKTIVKVIHDHPWSLFGGLELKGVDLHQL